MPLRLALAAALAALVAGCASPDRTPAEAHAAARDALDAGDADRALALFREAADGGHLGALQTVADARTRGHLTVPRRPGRAGGPAPVRSFPGQAAWARRAYQTALTDSARVGSPNALLMMAHDLTGPLKTSGGRTRAEMTEADREAAAAIYRGIVHADVPRLSLATLARKLGDGRAYRQHVEEAVAAGEPHACAFKVWMTGDAPDASTPAGFAVYLDRAEACPRAADGSDPAADGVRALAGQVAGGNAAAVDFLDGLRAEGAFRRHPRLGAVLDAALP